MYIDKGIFMEIVNILDDFPRDANICLYGTGDYGIAILRLLKKERPDVTVMCFIDTFKTREITYHYQMLGIVIEHPDFKEVIQLMPEPIIKQDGESKNDCLKLVEEL